MMPLVLTPLWHAKATRFLLMTLGLWVIVRVGAQIPGEVPLSPRYGPLTVADHVVAAVVAEPAPQSRIVEYAAHSTASATPTPAMAKLHRTLSRPDQALPTASLPTAPLPTASPGAPYRNSAAAPRATGGGDFTMPDRYLWRLALLGQIVPGFGQGQRAGAVRTKVAQIVPAPALPQASLRWPDQAGDRWSLSFAAYWRDSKSASSAVGPGGSARLAGFATLGGSQTSLRLAYQSDRAARLRAYIRLTDTPGPRGQSDIAVGLAARPVRSLPVDVHLERRFAVDGGGRDATLIYAAGGVDDRALPHGFRLSAYAQAGAADYGPTAGFADAVVVVEREIANKHGVRLSLGQVMAASVQPGARRIDIGPRAALDFPHLGNGATIALDWRERVAGNAQPGSGIALTVAADF